MEDIAPPPPPQDLVERTVSITQTATRPRGNQSLKNLLKGLAAQAQQPTVIESNSTPPSGTPAATPAAARSSLRLASIRDVNAAKATEANAKVAEFFLSNDERKKRREIMEQEKLRAEIARKKEEIARLNAGKALHPFLAPRPKPITVEGSNATVTWGERLEWTMPVFPSVQPVNQLNDEERTFCSNQISLPRLRTLLRGIFETVEADASGISIDLDLHPIRADSTVCTREERSLLSPSTQHGNRISEEPPCRFNGPIWESVTAEETDALMNLYLSHSGTEAMLSRLCVEHPLVNRDQIISQLRSLVGKFLEVSHRDSLWADKYRPTKTSEILGNQQSVESVLTWLSGWKEANKTTHTTKKKKRKVSQTSSDSEEASVDDSGDGCKALLLFGPSGCGKTATIHACANQLGYEVMEVNSSAKRAGKNILELFGEATQSHRLHGTGSAVSALNALISAETETPKVKSKSKKSDKKAILESFFKPKNGASAPRSTSPSKKAPSKPKPPLPPPTKQSTNTTASMASRSTASQSPNATLIVFEEVDQLFEDDKGFVPAVQNLIQSTKRPIILTCTEIPEAFQRVLSKPFYAPSASNSALFLQLVCAVEACIYIPLAAMNQVLNFFFFDLRQTLHHLNFWLSPPKSTLHPVQPFPAAISSVTPIDLDAEPDPSEPEEKKGRRTKRKRNEPPSTATAVNRNAESIVDPTPLPIQAAPSRLHICETATNGQVVHGYSAFQRDRMLDQCLGLRNVLLSRQLHEITESVLQCLHQASSENMCGSSLFELQHQLLSHVEIVTCPLPLLSRFINFALSALENDARHFVEPITYEDVMIKVPVVPVDTCEAADDDDDEAYLADTSQSRSLLSSTLLHCEPPTSVTTDSAVQPVGPACEPVSTCSKRKAESSFELFHTEDTLLSEPLMQEKKSRLVRRSKLSKEEKMASACSVAVMDALAALSETTSLLDVLNNPHKTSIQGPLPHLSHWLPLECKIPPLDETAHISKPISDNPDEEDVIFGYADLGVDFGTCAIVRQTTQISCAVELLAVRNFTLTMTSIDPPVALPQRSVLSLDDLHPLAEQKRQEWHLQHCDRFIQIVRPLIPIAKQMAITWPNAATVIDFLPFVQLFACIEPDHSGVRKRRKVLNFLQCEGRKVDSQDIQFLKDSCQFMRQLEYSLLEWEGC
eukprot:GILK01010774.1.p1 GENE.GILK01010774.1~~GILK01010774.1.p1  ORF type:complete len:1200 (+),score=219.29 GILK01010774.1:87-3602(+)